MNFFSGLYQSADIYKVTVDSVILSLNDNEDLEKLDIGINSGQFKHELGENSEIQSFFCLGNHAYHLQYKRNNETKQTSKLIGFKLEQAISKPISTENFELLLEKALENKREKISIDQIKISRDGSKIGHDILSYYLSNDLKMNRVILESGDSLPFGYSLDMLQNLSERAKNPLRGE